jgi:diguanylate cyclase (GGDEF)-like protein
MIEKATNQYWDKKGYAATSVYVTCCLLMGFVLFVDLATPLGIAIGVLYVIVVLLSFWSPSVKFTYCIAVVSSLLTIGVYMYKPSVAEMWKVIFNRSIALFVIWVTTFLGVKIKGAEQRLVEMASHDFLTGLLNRRELFNRLSIETSRVRRTNEALSLIMIDIDHFKNINDRHGHISGDMVLKEVAHRLREGIRDYDLICRFGGEEFLVMAPQTDLHHANELAERLRKVISERPFRIEDASPVTITISAGVTRLLEGESVETMISRADMALYHAKGLGRNRVETLQG